MVRALEAKPGWIETFFSGGTCSDHQFESNMLLYTNLYRTNIELVYKNVHKIQINIYTNYIQKYTNIFKKIQTQIYTNLYQKYTTYTNYTKHILTK